MAQISAILDHLNNSIMLNQVNPLIQSILKIIQNQQKNQRNLLNQIHWHFVQQKIQRVACDSRMWQITQKDFANIEIIKSNPIVSYKEIVSGTQKIACIIYAQAEQLHEGLQSTIEKGDVEAKDEIKRRDKLLQEKYEQDEDDALKIQSKYIDVKNTDHTY
ncbi:unnamed protein product [Paramecium sonneborni]|uniref:Uncharacterized protein n=1 Tax=Paramecium sonneborni TaxID=65129 RepID=A0A8S1PZQ3_9CILI|nr:unnamed protein product [Paramecium sonneborni]